MTFEEFIMQAREMDASDIHLTVGAPTVVRVNGELRKYTELSDQVVNRTILSILSAEQEKMLTEGKDIDFSFELKTARDSVSTCSARAESLRRVSVCSTLRYPLLRS